MKKALALVVLLLLLLVADRVGKGVAENALASKLDTELAATPEVDIAGFPFLTQAVTGKYKDITIDADGVRRSDVTLARLNFELFGAHIPLSRATGGDDTAVPVDRLAVDATVAYSELERLAAARGLTLAQSPGGVRVTGTFDVRGRSVVASTDAALRPDGNAIVVTGSDVREGDAPAAADVASALARRFDLKLTVPGLPRALVLSDVASTPEGIEIKGTARDTVIEP